MSDETRLMRTEGSSHYRRLFHVPEDRIYLLNHSIGCLPKTTSEIPLWEPWRDVGPQTWPHWLQGIETFRNKVAQLLSARPSEICPQTNNSSALSKVIQSLPHRNNRRRLLISKAHFPSLGFVLTQAKSQNQEYEIIWVDDTSGKIEAWEKALTPDTQLAVISHGSYGTSLLQPVAEICKIARERNIFSYIDIAQTAGVVPISALHWNPDFISGSCIKWLCGGPGAGFLWVNSNCVQELKPSDVGWFSHQHPFEFDITHFQYANDALRFWGGTPSVFPYLIASQSIQQILEIGVDTIRAHSQSLTQKLIESGIKTASPLQPESRGGTVTLHYAELKLLETALSNQNILVDSRPSYGIRVSPHIYTSESEIDQVIHAIHTFSRSR